MSYISVDDVDAADRPRLIEGAGRDGGDVDAPERGNPAGLPPHLQRKGLDVLKTVNQGRFEKVRDLDGVCQREQLVLEIQEA